ncbi:MAG: stage III sporulation protein AG [Lachnospiraceae bacterium]|nr:stage III sporulation protein AG [Lachnospiraceae bacterium]
MMESDKILPEKPVEKTEKSKKLRKDQCLIVILVGILLCVIALPVNKKDSKSNISNIIDDKIDNHIPADTAGDYSETAGSISSYTEYWENKLEIALKDVDGVGKVKVLINIRESEQKVVEKDGPEEYSDTKEEDGAGGSRTIGETRTEKNTIYTVDDNGRNIPYVVMTIAPTVEGVVVIAQGAGAQSVQENIIEAIQVLFDIEANKIKIVKMKNNQ